MGTNLSKKLSVALCICLFYFWFSCRPYGNCYEFYEFYIPVSVNSQDTFLLGDTLWITMDAPNQLTNHQTGEDVDLSDFELVLTFGISKVDSTLLVTGIGHLDSFEVVEELGELRQQVHVVARHRLYTESITEKQFRIGLVPRALGTYSIGLAISRHYMEVDGPLGLSKRNCYEDLITHTRVLVNDGQTNFYLVEGICSYDSEGIRYCYGSPDDKDGRYNGYYFHVKEP